MAENHDYLTHGESKRFTLSGDILLLMLRGASYAAIACLAIWFLVAVTFWVGKMLPDESRETEDPTPFSFNLTDQQFLQA